MVLAKKKKILKLLMAEISPFCKCRLAPEILKGPRDIRINRKLHYYCGNNKYIY